MIRTISYAALALFIVSASANVLAQNAPAGDPAKPIDGQIILQDKSTFLASAIIGSSVYSPGNGWVGDVNDLIVKPTGEIEAVVVGVGGFVGIGEKNVAIALDRFTMEPTPDFTSTKLVLNATKEELEAAPAFKSAYVQKLDEEYEQQSALLNSQYKEEANRYPTVPAPLE